MAMKKVYSKKTGKVTWAQPNPARPGEYLMPADATEFPPPAFDDSTKKAKYVNNSWVTEDLTPEEIHEASGSTGTFIAQLGDIANVTLDSITDGQALVWDATNNKWTNGNVAAGEGSVGVDGSGLIYEKSSVGMIAPFAMSTKPDGWLICDGSTLDSVTNTEYAALYDAIGTTWGGSGPSDFKLPDLRGSFLRGIGTGSINGRDKFGSNNVGEFQEDEFQGHRHDFKAYAFNNNNNNSYKETMFGNGVSPLNNVTGGGVYDPKSDGTNDTPRTGDETRPFNAGVLYCIKYNENEIQTIIDSETGPPETYFVASYNRSSVIWYNDQYAQPWHLREQQGNSFDSSTGVFTAPKQGLYRFDFFDNIRAGSGGMIYWDWHKNNSHIGYGRVYGNHNGGWEGMSGHLVISLEEGDTMRIKFHGNGGIDPDGNGYGLFTGYIMNQGANVTISNGTGIDGITSVDGRVGIGITPHHNLHLAGDSSQYGSALKIEENTHATSARAGIHLGDWVIGQDAPGDGTKDFFFYNAGHRLFIKDDGNIGINTTIPKSKLDIVAESTIGSSFTGNIHGEGITISKSYVADDYISLLESSNNIGNVPHVRIAARYNGGGSYLSFGTSANYGTGITNEALLIDPSGNCYINNLLYIKTVYGEVKIASENNEWLHFTTDRSKFWFNKQCQAVSGFATYSDERLKENVTVVENAVESIKKISGVTFTWKKNVDSQERPEGKKFGVLAQEVLQIDSEMCELPEAVTDGDEKFYTFDYSNLTPYFIEAIKEQQATIESQQAKIDSLEARLAALEAKLS